MSHPLSLSIDEGTERVVVTLPPGRDQLSFTHEDAAKLSGDLAVAATKLKMRLQVKRVKEQMARLNGDPGAAAGSGG